MSRALPFIFLTLALLATACSPAATATPPPAPPTEQDSPTAAGDVVASAVVVPAVESELSFVIPGTVQDIPVQAGDRVNAGQTLMVLYVPDLEFAVTQAEAAARAAEFEYQYWIPARLDRPPERRQLAEQEFIKVKQSLEVARAEWRQATLTAPFDGTIVSVDVTAGELVQPAQVVIAIANLDVLQVETTDLSERDLTEVAIGRPAAVFVEALGEEFAATVAAVSPKSDTVGGDVVYKITLEFDTQPPGLLWGMSAEVKISSN
jgi:RND family efflux transporter MFP subunit